jgi:hypothetical protein
VGGLLPLSFFLVSGPHQPADVATTLHYHYFYYAKLINQLSIIGELPIMGECCCETEPNGDALRQPCFIFLCQANGRQVQYLPVAYGSEWRLMGLSSD